MDLHSSSLWVTLGLLLALGFRHGLDPDHIATVDGLTRMRYKAHAYWAARLTGFQFACGHSLTILLATLVFYWQGIELPLWLDQAGLWISSVVLLLLAAANLRHCLSGQTHHHPAGLLRQLMLRAMGPLAHPMGVGFAFAISLDSLAQAGLMAAKGHELGGVGMIVMLSVCFGLGMILADTGNGLIMHWLISRSEAMTQQVSRVMSGVIAVLALLVVAVGHGRQHLAVMDQLWDLWSAWIGVGVTAAALLAYVLSRWRYRHVNHLQA